MAKVTMPQLGESVAEGTIGKWLKKPGDTVAKYEPLLEVITDKVNAEVPSPFAGVLREILVEEGATVPNNAEIAVIETSEEAAASGGTAPAPMALEKEAAPSEPDSGGPGVEIRSPQAPAAEAPAAEAPAAEAPAAEAPAEAQPAAATSAAEAPAEAQPVEAQPAVASPAPGPAPSDVRPAREADRAAATATQPPASTESGDEPRMTPAVRRLLREHGLTAAQIAGTGMGGRLTRDDVMAYVQQHGTTPVAGGASSNGSAAPAAQAPAPTAAVPTAAVPTAAVPTAAPAPGTAAKTSPTPAPAAGPAAASTTPSAAPAAPAAAQGARGISGQRVTFPEGADEVLLPMTQMRKAIAAQMTRALQVPHAYVQMEIDATRLVKLRESVKKDYQAREGSSLSFMPFVAKALVHALKKNPAFNAHWTEQGVLAKRRINMGVAVAVADGLIVPVVKDVDQLSIAGLNRAMAEVAARARNNKLRLDDIQGSTFTLDNTGWFGSNMTMPIINVPEVAIITMENITKRPVVVETPDGDVIAIRPVMNMVLAIDHRANDGAQAAAFLKDVKDWLESVSADLPIW